MFAPPKNAMEERPFCTAVQQLAVVNGSLRISKTYRWLMKWFQKFAAPFGVNLLLLVSWIVRSLDFAQKHPKVG